MVGRTAGLARWILDQVLGGTFGNLVSNLNLGGNDLANAGTVRAGDGTLSDPSITFENNQDDGLANPNDGELAIVLGGSEVTSISASSETADGMAADPETGSEDGFLTVQIGSNSYEIPLYDA